jgi:hypothetical protein
MKLILFQFHFISNIPLCILLANMDPKNFSSENSSMIDPPQNPSNLQENKIPISQSAAHNTSSLNFVPPIMNSEQQNYCLLTEMQNNPSWPAPSFTALLSMDYSVVLASELLVEDNPTNLFQLLNPIASPETTEIQSSLVTNSINLPPLQQPNNIHTNLVTTLPIPDQAPNCQASLLCSSLDSTLHPSISMQLTQANDASLCQVTSDPPRRVYSCIICGAMFYNAQALGGHMSYHSKNKRKKPMK